MMVCLLFLKWPSFYLQVLPFQPNGAAELLAEAFGFLQRCLHGYGVNTSCQDLLEIAIRLSPPCQLRSSAP